MPRRPFACRYATQNGPRTVAILPLQAIAEDAGLQRLTFGLASDMAAQLSRFRVVKVVASCSVIYVGGCVSSPWQTADQLGASLRSQACR